MAGALEVKGIFGPDLAWDGSILWMLEDFAIRGYDVIWDRTLSTPFPPPAEGWRYTSAGFIGGQNGWLVFLEVPGYALPSQWKLHAYHPRKQTHKLLLYEQGVSPPAYSFDGRSVLVTYVKQGGQQGCDASILLRINVKTGERKVLESHCVGGEEFHFVWRIGVHEGDHIAVEQMWLEAGHQSRLLLLRFSGEWERVHLLSDENNSSPVLAWPWLAWRRSSAHEWPRWVGVYRWQQDVFWLIETPRFTEEALYSILPKAPLLCSDYVVWLYGGPLVPPRAFLYRLPQGPLFSVQVPEPWDWNGKRALVCNDAWMAWVLDRKEGRLPGEVTTYRVEWMPLSVLEAME